MIEIPWIFNEDLALKIKLQGMTVNDQNAPNGRNVPVKYMMPEDEVSDLMFPTVVIRHVNIAAAPERMHDGYVQIPYAPEGLAPWWFDTGPATTEFSPLDSPYYDWFPTPYNFDYQITVYGRNMHLHLLPIVSQLAQYERLHARFPFLDIPQDGTKRTCQLIGGPEFSYTQDNNNKRMMTADYTFRVFSELVAPIDMTTNTPVSQINISLGYDAVVYSNSDDISLQSVEDFQQNFGIIATSGSFGFNTQALNS